MKTFISFLMLLLVVNWASAAKLSYVDSLQSSILESVAADWKIVTDNLIEEEVGEYTEYLSFSIVRRKYSTAKSFEKLENTALQMIYAYTCENEYEVEIKEITRNVETSILKNIFEDVLSGWSGDYVFLPNKSYSKLVSISKVLNRVDGIAIYRFEQAFSDGVYNGIIIVDKEESEALILGNLMAI